MPVKEVSFENSLHHVLSGILKFPSDIENKVPLVIVLHKFGSRSDQEFIVNIADSLYPNGFAVLRFDFHGHGDSGGDMLEVHITQAIDDVISAITFCSGFGFIDTQNTIVIGHGMGSDVGLLAAARDERITCLIMLAPASDLDSHTRHFSDDERRELQYRGFITHNRFGRVGREFFRHLKRYDPREEISKLHIPILLVHGRNDFQVRWESSKELYLAANEPKRFEIIDDCDHFFQDPAHRALLLDLILKWINHHIRDIRSYEAETTDRLEHARLF